MDHDNVVRNPFFRQHTEIIRRLADDPDCSLQWTEEAIAELGIDLGLSGEDIRQGLTECQIMAELFLNDEIAWWAQADIDGRTVEVLVVAYELEIAIKLIRRR